MPGDRSTQPSRRPLTRVADEATAAAGCLAAVTGPPDGPGDRERGHNGRAPFHPLARGRPTAVWTSSPAAGAHRTSLLGCIAAHGRAVSGSGGWCSGLSSPAACRLAGLL